ncbi:type IV pilin protein [Fibrobacter sp.]|uniref:type IV pilin protein n=1 Tax=Fibrobacter sp. TaxID=35828 RepID=UPI00388F45A1
MKKQGFTLIELMVVIVIMGILAAVAVPKLFGMIAKSKASEVPTAAGTYINMQDAFATEKATLGDWQEIGYSGPGDKSHASSYTSQNFDYYGTKPTGFTEENAWVADNRNKLGDCAAHGKWILKAEYLSSGNNEGSVKYTASNATAACLALTPAFSKLTNNLTN